MNSRISPFVLICGASLALYSCNTATHPGLRQSRLSVPINSVAPAQPQRPTRSESVAQNKPERYQGAFATWRERRAERLGVPYTSRQSLRQARQNYRNQLNSDIDPNSNSASQPRPANSSSNSPTSSPAPIVEPEFDFAFTEYVGTPAPSPPEQ